MSCCCHAVVLCHVVLLWPVISPTRLTRSDRSGVCYYGPTAPCVVSFAIFCSSVGSDGTHTRHVQDADWIIYNNSGEHGPAAGTATVSSNDSLLCGNQYQALLFVEVGISSLAIPGNANNLTMHGQKNIPTM